MYYPSKKDLWQYPLYWGTIIACFAPVVAGRDYVVLVFTVPLAILLIWGWFCTGYKVNQSYLIIRNGPFKKNVPIKEIKTIAKTKNLLAAPALSIDRLKIIYDADNKMALVSPKEQLQFLATLKSINPKIELDSKLNQ